MFMKNTGIESCLKHIAQVAWDNRTAPAVHKKARELTDEHPTVARKVEAIVVHVKRLNRMMGPLEPTHAETLRIEPPYDTDDAVLAAATMCLSVGIRCRIVGARYGESWCCWLAYQDNAPGMDNGGWRTFNVFDNVPVDDPRKPDEQIVVECQMPYTADPGTESEGSAEGDIDGTCLMLGTVMQAVEAKKQDPDNAAWLANLVYKALNAHRAAFGAPDLVRPPNPKHGHAIAVLFADGKDVVIRFEEQEIK